MDGSSEEGLPAATQLVALGRDCEMLAVLPLAPRPRLLAAPALSATPGRLPVLTAAASTQLPADGR